MIKFAIPSKGRLQEDTISWLTARGIDVARSSRDREYSATIANFTDVELVLMSAGEIPQALNEGRVHLGVTGQDMVQEKVPNWSSRLSEVAHMGFGFADLVLAIPASWEDVYDIFDLDAVCADFRKVTGKRLRIATKYHRLTGQFLRENDVTNFQLIDSQGATEGVVANEYAEMISDITSTGATLVANHLRILGEPILRSQATVFARKADLVDDAAALETFVKHLKG